MRQEELRIDESSLFYKDQLLVGVTARILKFIILKDTIILLVSADELNSEINVLGYSLNGKLKWQIPEPSKLHGDNFYTSIYIEGNDALKAYNISGVEVLINEENGEILHKELIK